MKQSILRFGLWMACSLPLVTWGQTATDANTAEVVAHGAAADSVQVKGDKVKTSHKLHLGLKHNRKPDALFQGVYVSADLFGYLGQVFGNEYISYEVAGEVNLKNRFFPIVEIGYGTVDYTDDDKDVHYQTAAPYYRAGFNYNFYHKRQTLNYIYGGLRVGYSAFNFDIDAPDLTDSVWEGSVPFDYQNVSCTAMWLEFVVGIRAQIYKSFHMGWSLRYKRRMSVTEHDFADAWYVPGFGINSSALFSATYNIIYHLPW